MNHNFESKDWADNHHVLSDGLARLFSSIGRAIIGLRAYVLATRSKGGKAPAGESEATCNLASSHSDVE